MRVLHRDVKMGLVKLAPQTLDDLWHLHHLIEKGDLVTAETYRTAPEPRQEGLDRAQKMSKRPVTLTLRVEEIEFAAFADRLRVRGPIVEGAQDLGSYHTFTFEADPTQELTIRKEKGFRGHHWDRVDEAVAAAKRPLVTIVALDDEEATVALLRQYGVHHHATIRGRTKGKMYEDTSQEEPFLAQVVDAVRRARPDNSPLVVVGPGFTREKLVDLLREKLGDQAGTIVTEGTGQTGMVGVQEALKRGIVDRIQKDQQVGQDTMLVEKIFGEIATNGPVGYGVVEVQRFLDLGAVSLLVLSDELLRTPVGEELLEMAQRVSAKSHIVAVTHEAGKKLQGLGGVAALLRYKPAA